MCLATHVMSSSYPHLPNDVYRISGPPFDNYVLRNSADLLHNATRSLLTSYPHNNAGDREPKRHAYQSSLS
jgi:hypothetical protein